MTSPLERYVSCRGSLQTENDSLVCVNVER